MAYSPWPGVSDLVAVRAARSATGPWGPAALLRLPGCDPSDPPAPSGCYGANIQPASSGGGRLGVGYYDRHIADDPTRGSFMVVEAPFRIG